VSIFTNSDLGEHQTIAGFIEYPFQANASPEIDFEPSGCADIRLRGSKSAGQNSQTQGGG
jgi:hypothetical protein